MKLLKRWIVILIGIFVIITIIAIVYKNTNKNNKVIEPEEEILEEEQRRTLVTLYFKNKISNKLEPEVQLVDVKDLVNNPYELLLKLLIKGPQNDVMQRLLPEKTKINKIDIEKDKLIIDFSEEILNVQNEDEQLLIDSLVNTLTELTEVNTIKILINGEDNKGFNNGEIMFNAEFSKND